MQNTGQGSEKKSYRVILLLVVGLAAFSSAMKELNQVHELTLQTSSLIAQWTDVIAPAEHNAILAKVETCDSQIAVPPVPPLPAPAVPPVELRVPDVVAPDIVAPVAPAIAPPAVPATPRTVPDVPVSKPRRVARPNHDSAEVRVLLSTDELVEKSLRDTLEADVMLKALKAKNRRHQIFISPDGKDIILKSLNRSINLRSAS